MLRLGKGQGLRPGPRGDPLVAPRWLHVTAVQGSSRVELGTKGKGIYSNALPRLLNPYRAV